MPLNWAQRIQEFVGMIAKGQLISKENFGNFKSPKKRTKFLKDFCPASKMGQIKNK